MSADYVVSGGTPVATIMGYWGKGAVPPGKFAVVHNGELSNGGRGPILSLNRWFGSEDEALREAKRLLA